MKALILSQDAVFAEAVPAVLSRAGYSVVACGTDPLLARSRAVTRFEKASDADDLVRIAAAEVTNGSYDLVVCCEDASLFAVKNSSLPADVKLRLLPVCDAAGLDHIASKIGLSEAFARGGVRTPEFVAVRSPAELERAAERLRFPFMVKEDFGCSGTQVWECASLDEVRQVAKVAHYPAIAQEKIEGVLTSFDAFFADGELVFFSQAVQYQVIKNKDGRSFGPSATRLYESNPFASGNVVDQLRKVGRSLHAHGFSNITAVVRPDGDIQFFEADMRPNVWVEYPKYFGQDPSAYIREYMNGKNLRYHADLVRSSERVVLAYLPRLRLVEILSNKMDCKRTYENHLDRNVILLRTWEAARHLWEAVTGARGLHWRG